MNISCSNNMQYWRFSLNPSLESFLWLRLNSQMLHICMALPNLQRVWVWAALGCQQSERKWCPHLVFCVQGQAPQEQKACRTPLLEQRALLKGLGWTCGMCRVRYCSASWTSRPLLCVWLGSVCLHLRIYRKRKKPQKPDPSGLWPLSLNTRTKWRK